jgi:hypothetical protein
MTPNEPSMCVFEQSAKIVAQASTTLIPISHVAIHKFKNSISLHSGKMSDKAIIISEALANDCLTGRSSEKALKPG